MFHKAQASIGPNLTIVLTCPEVSEIKAIRYCFHNFAIGRIHDTYGMPLVPFRTDNWEE